MKEIKITEANGLYCVEQGEEAYENLEWRDLYFIVLNLLKPISGDIYEPKDGDVVTFNYPDGQNKVIAIFKSAENAEYEKGGYYDLYAAYFSTGTIDTPCSLNTEEPPLILPASPAEKLLIFATLIKNGKEWNEDKKEMMDYRWMPEMKQTYYYPFFLQSMGKFIATPSVWVGHKIDTDLWEKGYVCRTIQECEQMCDKFNDAITVKWEAK